MASGGGRARSRRSRSAPSRHLAVLRFGVVRVPHGGRASPPRRSPPSPWGSATTDYVDVDWGRLLRLVPTVGRGFAGILRGDAIEAAYRRLLGDMTLGEMPIPGLRADLERRAEPARVHRPRTHPDLPVARAVHMAIALPLFIQPVELGGIPLVRRRDRRHLPGAPGSRHRGALRGRRGHQRFLPAGSRARTPPAGRTAAPASSTSPARCEPASRSSWPAKTWPGCAVRRCDMIEPVPYEKVRGVGFYRQFLSTRDWPGFMRGRAPRDTPGAGDDRNGYPVDGEASVSPRAPIFRRSPRPGRRGRRRSRVSRAVSTLMPRAQVST